MDRRIIKRTCVIPYMWIETGIIKSSHMSKQGILRKKINKHT